MQTKLFGCKVNAYYLNQRLHYFSQKNSIMPNALLQGELPTRIGGGVQTQNSILIASCEVTDRAKKKYIKEIISYAQAGKHIFLTGCGSIELGKTISENKFYNRYPELKKYNSQITLLPESPYQNTKNSPLLIGEGQGVRSNNKQTKDQPQIHGNLLESGLSTRKPIIIQTGCDNFCSFCLTVLKRGKHQSRPAGEIIDEINEFHSQSGNEIVITGINLAARGCEQTTNPEQSKFSELLQKIIANTDIPRIRISSLGPEYLDDKFFEIIQNPRFMNHFHLSIQSFSDSVLQNMRRNYNSQVLDQVLTHFKHLNNLPGQGEDASRRRGLLHSTSLGADIITSFPGETDTDFQITLESLSKYNITKLHAFPFSDHHLGQTIPASLLPNQVDSETKKLRQQKIIAEGNKIRQNFINSQKGQEFEVLLEQEKNGLRHGWTPNYIEIQVSGTYQTNQIINYKLQ